MSLEPTFPERRVLLRCALSFVGKSSRLIRSKLAAGPRVRLKDDGSPVTDADLAAERLLRRLIVRRFPDHGIQGEEFPPVRPRAEFQWFVDPIDGTMSFTREIPLFGTIVALHHLGRPLLGVIDHPALQETTSAAAGLGAFRNGRRITVSSGNALKNELVAVCYRDQFLRCRRQAAFDRLMRSHPNVRTYGDCFGHILAARGAVGAMVDVDINPWDLAATQVIIEEAGGKYVVLARRGKRRDILFGKPKVVDRLLPILK
ncbi:MAG: hypothetical protein HY077_06860 [Elusimicrobia bacterium]|nr:hypothetical protein [Elusimicrobiota bacterium]